ncbi:MAG: hypothetical protein ABI870_07425, partial [Rhodanobacter sp.]
MPSEGVARAEDVHSASVQPGLSNQRDEAFAGSFEDVQAEGFRAGKQGSTAVIVSIRLENIMPNNNPDNQDT